VKLAALLAVIAAVAGAVAIGSAASAQGPGTRTLTFKELERGSTFIHVRNTKPPSRRANLLGDQLTFTNPLADASGTVVGKTHITCTTTVGARNFMRSTLTCTGVAVLRDGTVTLQANTSPGVPTTTGAVTGGTGAYANARGTFVSEEARGGSNTTVTLVAP
jgi:hypothetical protein